MWTREALNRTTTKMKLKIELTRSFKARIIISIVLAKLYFCRKYYLIG